MNIIVGLGNPGKKYQSTRHNSGFLALEELKQFLIVNCDYSGAQNFQFSKRFNAEILKLIYTNSTLVLSFRNFFKDIFNKKKNDKFLLIKPMTFMNESGKAVKKIIKYYNFKKWNYDNLYIIHDDLDITLGKYKIQFGKGAAGHHGVESIIKELGTKDFWRIRIGIKSQNSKLQSKIKSLKSEQYVLEKFTKKEKEILDKVIQKATADFKKRILEKKD